MEEFIILGDVIADLLAQGYSLHFDALEQRTFGRQCGGVAHPVGKEFVVDRVYRCLEHEGAREVIYVFALSSLTLGLKGIAVSMAVAGPGVSVGDMFRWLKSAALRFVMSCRRGPAA